MRTCNNMCYSRLSRIVLLSAWLVWNIGRPLRRMLPKWTMHERTHSAITHPSNDAHHSDHANDAHF
jgi:ABC-type nickel/cobalt efflux system permease component RcnA